MSIIGALSSAVVFFMGVIGLVLGSVVTHSKIDTSTEKVGFFENQVYTQMLLPKFPCH